MTYVFDKKRFPPRPNVKEPAVWSWAGQQIASRASQEAIESLLEEDEEYLRKGPYSRLTATNDLFERLESDPNLNREYYERVKFFIPRVKPNLAHDPRPGDLPRKRAEALLYTWEQAADRDERAKKKSIVRSSR